jgi:hypothetical protein
MEVKPEMSAKRTVASLRSLIAVDLPGASMLAAPSLSEISRMDGQYCRLLLMGHRQLRLYIVYTARQGEFAPVAGSMNLSVSNHPAWRVEAVLWSIARRPTI